MARVLVALGCGLVLLAGCGSDGADVLVELRTDLVPGVELDRVRTELLTELPTVGSSAGSRVAERPVAAEDNLSRAARVAEFASISPGVYYVRLQAILGAGIVAERIVRVEVNGTVAVTIVLTRGCRGTRCPRSGDPASAVSCVGGLCVDPGCATGREPECPPRECATDDTCRSPVPCAAGSCADGLCLVVGDDSACAAGQRCHPELGCVDTATCIPLSELCNGADDDCDDLVDEDFDLSSDPENCGSCGTRCGSAHATAQCVASECRLTCDASFLDCNGDNADGCETDISRAETCGACDGPCDGATPLCELGAGGAYACASACPAATEDCGGACIDTQTSPQHCGDCATSCPDPPGSTPSCVAGTCGFTCDSGWANCNAVATDGCEARLDSDPNNCGMCARRCSLANATASCVASMCSISSCSAGWDDCDAADGNGCEQALSTLSHCGSCGAVCSRANATATCATRSCRVASCNSGWDNCDGSDANGCEQQLNTPSHCGGCGIACGVDEDCMGASCTCGLSSGAPGSGRVCRVSEQCCPEDRCRNAGALCP